MNERLQIEIEKYTTEKHLKSEAFLVSSIAEHFYNLALEAVKKQKESKFKVGDRISRKGKPHEYIFTVQEVLDDCYILNDDKILTFNWEDGWELAQDEPKKLAQTWIGPDGKEYARSNGISAEVGDKDTIYEVIPINPKYISGSALDGIKKGDKCYLLVVKDDENRDS